MGDASLFGVYAARVVDVLDPEGLGRVRVRLTTAKVVDLRRAWARLATLMAGDQSGTWFIPDVDDEVLVAFEGGDPRSPYVVGALWNASSPPPEAMDAAGANPRRVIASRAGARIAIDDDARSVEVSDTNGNRILLEPSGITIQASAKLTVEAGSVEVSAGPVQVNAGNSQFSGMVKCDTLLTNSVIASSYTPGVGNIW
jgi:phage baseplate assembly protein V